MWTIDWCDTGIRYYNKVLNRNIAIREFSQDNTYTAKGNINYFIREKSLPLTYRKKYFDARLQEYKNQNNITKEENLI